MDLEIPGSSTLHHGDIWNALEKSELTIEDIDICAERIINTIFPASKVDLVQRLSLSDFLVEVPLAGARAPTLHRSSQVLSNRPAVEGMLEADVALVGQTIPQHS